VLPAPAPRAQSPDDIGVRLDTAVRRAGLGQFWGAVLVARDGEVLLSRGYGYATEDLDPIRSDSLFDVGSITKMFTAAAVLKLQQNGALDVQDTLAAHFPEVGPAARQITIHHLLTHTSGKSDTAGAIQDLSFDDRDEAVRRFVASPPSRPPGEAFEYCNGGYVVLAAIIEQVSGQAYESCLRELVLQPAGMPGSGFLDGEGLDPTLQTMRVCDTRGGSGRRGLLLDKRVEPWAWGLRGAGGLVTSLDDLLAFDAAIRAEGLLGRAYLFIAQLVNRSIN
jgi:CubicO group peptidase (beta-lactamase class C family)